ncbi:MAG: biotin/lipoyl-containing protein, partial [Aeromicrobium sp.]
PAGFGAVHAAAPHHATKAAPKRSSTKAKTVASGDALTSPMQGTIVKIAVEDGQTVAQGDLIVVLEAMKMEQPITAHKAGAAAGGNSLTSPMQGTIVKIAVEEGQEVAAGDLVVVLEAMKMEQPLNAHKAGVITGLNAEVGVTVGAGSVIAEITDIAAS